VVRILSLDDVDPAALPDQSMFPPRQPFSFSFRKSPIVADFLRPVQHGVSKGVEDDPRLPALWVACLQYLEGSGMTVKL
jgi:hypothetical protein